MSSAPDRRRAGAEIIAIVTAACLMIGFTLYGMRQGYPRQAILFPGIVSGLGALFAVARLRELAGERRRDGVPSGDASAEAGETSGERTSVTGGGSLVAFAWVFAVLPVVWLAGYPVGLALYVGAFLLGHGIGARLALAIAVGAGAFVQIVFVALLEVRLPAGILASLLT